QPVSGRLEGPVGVEAAARREGLVDDPVVVLVDGVGDLGSVGDADEHRPPGQRAEVDADDVAFVLAHGLLLVPFPILVVPGPRGARVTGPRPGGSTPGSTGSPSCTAAASGPRRS